MALIMTQWLQNNYSADRQAESKPGCHLSLFLEWTIHLSHADSILDSIRARCGREFQESLGVAVQKDTLQQWTSTISTLKLNKKWCLRSSEVSEKCMAKTLNFNVHWCLRRSDWPQGNAVMQSKAIFNIGVPIEMYTSNVSELPTIWQCIQEMWLGKIFS